MHKPLVFACAEPPVDRSAVKPVRREARTGSAALRCRLNATESVLVLEHGWGFLVHCLLDEVGEEPEIFHCLQAHGLALPCKAAFGTAAPLRRTGPRATDAVGKSLARHGGYMVLDARFVIPSAIHAVDRAELPVPSKPEVRQGSVLGSLPVQIGSRMRDAPGVEPERENPFPSHRHRKHAVKSMQRHARRHPQTPPDHGFDPRQPDFPLQNRFSPGCGSDIRHAKKLHGAFQAANRRLTPVSG